ncbi:MAG: hypothetical protein QXU74_02530 [Candidatus Aenigmatarchaeota archaeon]
MGEYCKERFKDRNKINILEIGPGDGTFCKNFTQYLKEIENYFVVDFSRRNASYLKGLAYPLINEMGHLSVRDCSQDLVLALEVLDDSPVEFMKRSNGELEIKVVDGVERYVPLKSLGQIGEDVLKNLEEACVKVGEKEQLIPTGLIRTISEANRILAPNGLFIAIDWFCGEDLPFKEPCFCKSRGTYMSRVNKDVIERLSKKYGLGLKFELLRDFLEKTKMGERRGILFETNETMEFVTEEELLHVNDFYKSELKPYYEWFSKEDFHILILEKPS